MGEVVGVWVLWRCRVVKLLKLEGLGCRAGTMHGRAGQTLASKNISCRSLKKTTNVIWRLIRYLVPCESRTVAKFTTNVMWRLIRYLVPYESRTVAKFCDCVGPDGRSFVWDCCFGLMGLEVR